MSELLDRYSGMATKLGEATEKSHVCRAKSVQDPSQLITWSAKDGESLALDHFQESPAELHHEGV